MRASENLGSSSKRCFVRVVFRAAMFAAVKQCWNKSRRAFTTQDGVVYGTPLLDTPWLGTSISAATAFAMTVEQQTRDEQAFWYGEDEYEKVMDWETGGMYANATKYKTSFFVEGAKYLAPTDEGRVCIIFSTSQSNIASRYDYAKPYLTMEVYESHEEGHTLSGGRGMELCPGSMNSAYKLGTVQEVFKGIDFTDVWNLDDLFVKAGVTNKVFFICGYHIHGTVATVYDGKFCALDWYSQSGTGRAKNPDVYEHFLILDQVCPTECYKAVRFERAPGPYVGWHKHCVGGQ